MKELFKIILCIMFLWGVIYLENSIADTGYEGAVRTERGSYVGTRKVLVSSFTTTALFSADTKRPDSVCFNNSAYTVYIGSASAAVGHLIDTGLIWLSSAVFKLDGSFTGALDSTCTGSNVSCEVRCLDSLVR